MATDVDYVLGPDAITPPCPKGSCPICWIPVALRTAPGDAWAYGKSRRQLETQGAMAAMLMRSAMGEGEEPVAGLMGGMLNATRVAVAAAEIPALTQEQALAHGVPWEGASVGQA